MYRQRHEIRFPAPITAIFPVLVDVLGHGRWSGPAAVVEAADGQLGVGSQYVQQRGSVLRRGRVLECLRPVAITLEETLFDPPCRVRLILRWRLEPVAEGTLVWLEARYVLRGAAPLRKRHWDGQIQAHCERMIARLRAGAIAAARPPQPEPVGVSGQIQGSNSMTVTNTTSVSGTPSLR